MPIKQQGADVRFREIDLSAIIATNSSSRGAIVLVSKQGRPGRFNVSNTQAFVSEYGQPDAAVSFGHYCSLDFLQEGSSLDVVRVVSADAKFSALLLNDAGGVTGLVNEFSGAVTGTTNPAGFDFDGAVATSDVPLVLFTPKKGQGSHGDYLSVKISTENVAVPGIPTGVQAALGGSLAAGTYNYKVSAISNIGETLPSTQSANITIAAGTSNKVTVSWAAVEGARGYRLYGRTGGTYLLIATLGANELTFEDTGAVTPAGAAPTVAPTPTARFTVSVFDSRYSLSDALETWECTLKDDVDDTGTQLEISQRINAFSELINVVTNVPNLLSAPPTIRPVAMTSLKGGTSGSAVTNNLIAAAWSTYFGDAEKVKVQLLINGGYTDVTVQQQMVQVAQKRGDAVALLDIPSASQSANNAVKYRTLVAGIDSSYCGWYTADNFQSDLYNGKKLYTPPSGWAAAICARTDRIVGAQGAPAGMNRALLPILGTRVEYDDPERTYLFENKINYTRKIIGSGNFIWEQVTGQSKNSALSWLNVRRMINVIKTSVKDFLMFSLQEPNDDFTRKQIITACTEYLQSWKDARGIQDFKVVVDDTNNTPAFYNLGILKVAFFITPIIPIHEIQVDVVMTKKGVSFSEVNIQNLA
jgi:hypothetical protein